MSDDSAKSDTIGDLLDFLRRDLAREKLSNGCEKRRQDLLVRLERMRTVLNQLTNGGPEVDFDDENGSLYQPVEANEDEDAYLRPRVSTITSASSGAPKQTANPRSTLYEPVEQSGGKVGEQDATYANQQAGQAADPDGGDTYIIMEDPPTPPKPSKPLEDRGFKRGKSNGESEKRDIDHSGELYYCANGQNATSTSGWKRLRSCAISAGRLDCCKSAANKPPVVTLELSSCSFSVAKIAGCAQKHAFRVIPQSGLPALLAATSLDTMQAWIFHLKNAGVTILEEDPEEYASENSAPSESNKSGKLRKAFGALLGRRKDSSANSNVSGLLERNEAGGVTLSGRLFVRILPAIDYDILQCRATEDGRFEVMQIGSQTCLWSECLADGTFELRAIFDCGVIRKGGAMIVLRNSTLKEDALILEADDKAAETTWLTELRFLTRNSQSSQNVSQSQIALSLPEEEPDDELYDAASSLQENEAQAPDEPVEDDIYDAPVAHSPKKSLFNRFKTDPKVSKNKLARNDSDRKPQLPPRPSEIFTSAPTLASAPPVPPPLTPSTADNAGKRKSPEKVDSPSVATAEVAARPKESPNPLSIAAKRSSRVGAMLTGFEIASHRLETVQDTLRKQRVELAALRLELVQLRSREKETALSEQETARKSELQHLVNTMQAETHKLRSEEDELRNQVKNAVVSVPLRPTARRQFDEPSS